MNGRELSFRKKISSTDLTRNLEIPSRARHLPDGNQTMRVLYQNERPWHFKCWRRRGGRLYLTDQWVLYQNERRWHFKCSRRGGRLYLTDQWREFVRTVTPREGDTMRFYYSAAEDVYYVELERTIDIELRL